MLGRRESRAKLRSSSRGPVLSRERRQADIGVLAGSEVQTVFLGDGVFNEVRGARDDIHWDRLGDVVTRLWPTRLDGPAQDGSASVAAAGTSMTCKRPPA